MRRTDYTCHNCGINKGRENTFNKRVQFMTFEGSKHKTLRSRSVARLCRECLELDPDWNAEPYANMSEPTEEVSDGQPG